MVAMQRISAKFTICLLLVTVTPYAPRAATLVMPQDLVEFAHTKGCIPIDNFYDRPGMVNPPYVYGWLSGNPEESAVFWCQKAEKSEKPYKLVFKVREPKRMEGCPAIIEWWNPPGGLSVEVRSHLSLSDFRYVNEPKRAGPASTVLRARVIVDYYDGLMAIFYCYQGEWLVRSVD
jgi:hypothetical protein